MQVPPKEEYVIEVTLSVPEQQAYDAIHAAVQDYVSFLQSLTSLSLTTQSSSSSSSAQQEEEEDSSRALTANSSTVLAYITRMRQVGNLPARNHTIR
jgi:uncharacterized protein YkwD